MIWMQFMSPAVAAVQAAHPQQTCKEECPEHLCRYWSALGVCGYDREATDNTVEANTAPSEQGSAVTAPSDPESASARPEISL